MLELLGGGGSGGGSGSGGGGGRQAQSSVPIGEPLFQPSPPEVVFANYAPFEALEATLRLRNNDAVARRVRVEAPDSAVFSVRRAAAAVGADGNDAAGGSKVAPGMEAAFVVTFRPQHAGSARAALVVATERERFEVPLVGAGAAAALDAPDAFTFRAPAPVRTTAQQPLLLRNVGGAAGAFSLAASGPFSVAPARARLAPGESLQAVLSFAPPAAGAWEGELEVRYDAADANEDGTAGSEGGAQAAADGGEGGPCSSGGSRATYTRLWGEGCELPVGLSAGRIDFLPTHMGHLSQRSVWVVNDSDRAIEFAFHQRPDDSLEDGGGAVRGNDAVGSGGGGLAADDAPPVRDSDCAQEGDDGGRGAGHVAEAGAAPLLTGRSGTSGVAPSIAGSSSSSSGGISSTGTAVLADAALAAAREAKRARRAADADLGLFAPPHFAAFPPRGSVPAGARAEVVLQFAPDEARAFAATAFVALDGRTERAPLELRGAALGPVLCFPFESLDVGDAFVGTPHEYEVEVTNRGRVAAEFALQATNTRVGARFAFSPDSGALAPGGAATIKVRFVGDALGPFDETFRWRLRGCPEPVAFGIRGRVVGPTFELDARAVDFGVQAFGYKHERALLLTNTSKIPLTFSWRLVAADDGDDGATQKHATLAGGSTPPATAAAVVAAAAAAAAAAPTPREFAVVPAQGTVPPGGSQRLTIEFEPQAVQRCRLLAVMDQPGIVEAAARVRVTAECAVPVLAVLPAGAALDFGDVFLDHPAAAAFELVNDSRLPAKFEVLPQDAASRGVAAFSAEPAAGSVPPKGRRTVEVTVRAARLGRMQLPLLVATAGSCGAPKRVVLNLRAHGPHLEFTTASAAATAAAAAAAAATAAAAAESPLAKEASGASGRAGAAPLSAGPSSKSVGGASDAGSQRSGAGGGRASSISSAGKKGRLAAAAAAAAAAGDSKPSPWQPTAALSFDKVPVLAPATRELRLRNPTAIAARVTAFVEGADSVFEVEPRELEIAPGAEAALRVTALLDDAAPFLDALHVAVTDGADTAVPLEATGVGSTVVCEELAAAAAAAAAATTAPAGGDGGGGGGLDFGQQLVGRPWAREFVVSNFGRRGVSLVWANARADELAKAAARAAAANKGNKDAQGPAAAGAAGQPAAPKDDDASAAVAAAVFRVTPERVSLGAREAVTFTVSGLAARPGAVSEQLFCVAQPAGAAAGRSAARVFDVAARADVEAPLLEWSARGVRFAHVHRPGAELGVLHETLTMRCVRLCVLWWCGGGMRSRILLCTFMTAANTQLIIDTLPPFSHLCISPLNRCRHPSPQQRLQAAARLFAARAAAVLPRRGVAHPAARRDRVGARRLRPRPPPRPPQPRRARPPARRVCRQPARRRRARALRRRRVPKPRAERGEPRLWLRAARHAAPAHRHADQPRARARRL